MNAPDNRIPVPEPSPPFVIGVSGILRMEREEALKVSIRQAFNILLEPDSGQLHLKFTPIVVLTSLAPGADTLVAEVAEDMEQKYQEARLKASDPASFGPPRRFRIVAPLPFPYEQYLRATTFKDLTAEQREVVSQKLKSMCDKGDAFFVPLREDLDLSDDLLLSRLGEDLKAPLRRHLRYRASGEYIATHSNILLVINNDNPADEVCPDDVDVPVLAEMHSRPFGFGSSEIMRLKRQGVTPGLLSTDVAFAWADAGPVFHIKMSGANDDPPAIVRLYPVDTLPFGGKKVRNNDPIWQVEARRVFIAIGQQHEQFNALVQNRADIAARGQEAELDEFLGSTSFFPHAFREALDRLSRVRRHASNLANHFSSEWDRLIGFLFLGTLMTGLIMHLAVHWHPRPRGGNPDIGVEEHAEGLRTILTFSALACGGLSLMRWLFYRYSSSEAHRYDYRALAEALRVQIYWAAAGLNRSVPANYLQRQRSEMVWVRRVITAMAAPYFQWREWFHLMPLKNQVIVLRHITEKWLTRPKYGQVDYTYLRARMHESNEHFWRTFGAELALSGFMGAAVWGVMLTIPDLFRTAFPQPLHWVAVGVGVLFMVLWLAGTIWAVRRAQEKEIDKLAEPKEDACPRPRVWSERPKVRHYPIEGFKWSWNMLLYIARFGNAFRRIEREHGRIEIAVRFVGNAIVIALLTIAAADICSRLGSIEVPTLPDARGWWLIYFGGFLILGGLAIAWAERNMMAEHARQFAAMESMYQAASRRLKGHLTEAQKAVDEGRDADAKGRIEAIQELFYQIGVQALDENAEWLILHRARPIEPVPMG
jgi:hypothetical protein